MIEYLKEIIVFEWWASKQRLSRTLNHTPTIEKYPTLTNSLVGVFLCLKFNLHTRVFSFYSYANLFKAKIKGGYNPLKHPKYTRSSVTPQLRCQLASLLVSDEMGKVNLMLSLSA